MSGVKTHLCYSIHDSTHGKRGYCCPDEGKGENRADVTEEVFSSHRITGMENDRGKKDVEKYFRVERSLLINFAFLCIFYFTLIKDRSYTFGVIKVEIFVFVHPVDVFQSHEPSHDSSLLSPSLPNKIVKNYLEIVDPCFVDKFWATIFIGRHKIKFVGRAGGVQDFC